MTPNRLSSKMRTLCHMIFGYIYDDQPAVKQNWDVWSRVFGHICDVSLAVQRNVDVLSHDFWPHLRTFSHMIFGRICDVQPVIRRNLEALPYDFGHICKSSQLFHGMWTFCHMIFNTFMMFNCTIWTNPCV
jgi:hypothetical protein